MANLIGGSHVIAHKPWIPYNFLRSRASRDKIDTTCRKIRGLTKFSRSPLEPPLKFGVALSRYAINLYPKLGRVDDLFPTLFTRATRIMAQETDFNERG